MSIYKKLAEIQSAIRGLGQDKAGNNYNYVSGSKVLSVIKPLMIEQGLLLKQEVIEIRNERQDYIAGKGQYASQKSEILTTLLMRFTWVDVETGEKDENLFATNGQNGWDKGVGSALTYGERYFLLKYFHIATDEDDIEELHKEVAESDAFPASLAEEIAKAKTKDELSSIYNRELQNFPDATKLIELLGNRKREDRKSVV